MFPTGCPSFQKAVVKLYKVDHGPKGEKLHLIDTSFFNNRDGFGFMKHNLTKGDYQLQFKKYSNGFDVFDFTTRIYSEKMIKLIDDDDEQLKKVILSKEVEDKIPTIKDPEAAMNAAEKKKNAIDGE